MATALAVPLKHQPHRLVSSDEERDRLPAYVPGASMAHEHASVAPAVATGIGVSLQELMHQLLVDNLHRGLTLKELSGFIGYSEKYCSEWFVAHMGRSFSSYVKQLRVERAISLLGSHRRLADIAEAVGFQDQYAFSHFFKKATGISPQGYRERSRHLGQPSQRGSRRRSLRSTCPLLREVPA